MVTVKLEIPACIQRKDMVFALSESGHKVWIEQDKDPYRNDRYYVCVEVREEFVYDDVKEKFDT